MNFQKIVKSQNLLLFFSKNIYTINRYVPFELEPGTYPFRRRQIPLDGLKTFDERLKEIEIAKNGAKLKSVNIGYELPKESVSLKKAKHSSLEALARKRQIVIDVNDLDSQNKNSCFLIKHKHQITNFYNIYNDLFHYPHFFYSIKNMEVEFDCQDNHTIPVCTGNLISPSNTMSEPIISFESEENSLWTLVMSSPDEHLQENDKEYVHWIISNMVMKDGVLHDRECIVPYLQPIPYLGTGFHRYVFVLYKQDSGKIDLSKFSLSEHCLLEERTFSSYEFLKANQDLITPVSVSFFQAAWDPSVRHCFREQLNCLEPLFEYVWPKQRLKPMKEFPENEVMHTYLDKYRDLMDIQNEVLKERLKTVDPFKKTKRLEFPLAVPNDPNEMIFVKKKFEDKELRRNQWRDLDIRDEFSS